MLKNYLLSGFCALAIAVPGIAGAQEDEIVGDGEKVRAAPEKSAAQIVRDHRALCITLATPWNGLVGVGPILSYYPDAHVGIDGGIGIGGTGVKYGLRLRYLFITKIVTPFVGAGFMSGGGTGDASVQMNSDNNPITIKLARTNFVQFLAGMDLITSGGFMFLGGLGYADCLNRNNVTVVDGVPTDVQNQAINLAYRGGLVIELDVGYAFRIK